MTFNEGIETGNSTEGYTPSCSALLVVVESRTVTLLRTTALCRPQIGAGFVVLVTDTAPRLAVVTWLVVEVAIVTPITEESEVFSCDTG
jgi:hypothetical protein